MPESGNREPLVPAEHTPPGKMSTSRDIWSTGLAKPSHLLAGLGPWATSVGPLD